ncbi:MAG: TetR/AcrR family transcriptional regulator, partial [Caulobacteraceae bacterium]|nr:TetR/AcrR family transcriptional regulator [Caulobacteraceae bacterium]
MAAILTAAARILAEGGWTALNTNLVARRAGVSVGSVYEYFPDKTAILDAILDQHLADGEALIAGYASLLDQTDHLEGAVELLVDGFIALHQGDPRLHRVLSSEVPLTPGQRERVHALRSAVIGLLGDRLQGQVPAPALAATLLVDVADAVTHRWFVDEAGVPAPPDILAAELRRV